MKIVRMEIIDEWAKLAKQNDQEAWENLFNYYWPKFLKWGYNDEDIAGQMMLWLVTLVHKWQPDYYDQVHMYFHGYLFMYISRLKYNFYSAQKRRRDQLGEGVWEDKKMSKIPGNDISYINIDDTHRIHEFLETLTEREKLILELRLRDWFQYEIANVIGVSQTMIHKILTKNIKKKYLEFVKREEGNKDVNR